MSRRTTRGSKAAAAAGASAAAQVAADAAAPEPPGQAPGSPITDPTGASDRSDRSPLSDSAAGGHDGDAAAAAKADALAQDVLASADAERAAELAALAGLLAKYPDVRLGTGDRGASVERLAITTPPPSPPAPTPGAGAGGAGTVAAIAAVEDPELARERARLAQSERENAALRRQVQLLQHQRGQQQPAVAAPSPPGGWPADPMAAKTAALWEASDSMIRIHEAGTPLTTGTYAVYVRALRALWASPKGREEAKRADPYALQLCESMAGRINWERRATDAAATPVVIQIGPLQQLLQGLLTVELLQRVVVLASGQQLLPAEGVAAVQAAMVALQLAFSPLSSGHREMFQDQRRQMDVVLHRCADGAALVRTYLRRLLAAMRTQVQHPKGTFWVLFHETTVVPSKSAGLDRPDLDEPLVKLKDAAGPNLLASLGLIHERHGVAVVVAAAVDPLLKRIADLERQVVQLADLERQVVQLGQRGRSVTAGATKESAEAPSSKSAAAKARAARRKAVLTKLEAAGFQGESVPQELIGAGGYSANDSKCIYCAAFEAGHSAVRGMQPSALCKTAACTLHIGADGNKVAYKVEGCKADRGGFHRIVSR